jgi:uncharacterized protein DUF6527
VTRPTRVEHEFVEFVPNELAEATLYISIPYATCVHLCLCGCSNRVVTPLSPTDWRLTFDGETVSLDPSVGNWSFDCQSHYWIERSHVHWARGWSRERIDANRARARRAKQRYFEEADGLVAEVETTATTEATDTSGWLGRLLQRLRR